MNRKPDLMKPVKAYQSKAYVGSKVAPVATVAPFAAIATDAASKAVAERNGASEPATGTVVPTGAPASRHGAVMREFGHSGTVANRQAASGAGETKAINTIGKGVSHSHYCSHCNRTFTCHSNPCIIPGKPIKIGNDKPKHFNYDISSIHKCDEAKLYRKRMITMLGDKPKCKYNCDKDCNHDYKAEIDSVGLIDFSSKYSIDGITSRKEANSVRKAWYKASINQVKDSFRNTPWLANLAADFRQK